MHVVTPRSFNDAQQVADEFKRAEPVIINLQTTDRELSKRLIDFASGMTYALGGGMQRIAEQVFLLTPATSRSRPRRRPGSSTGLLQPADLNRLQPRRLTAAGLVRCSAHERSGSVGRGQHG